MKDWPKEDVVSKLKNAGLPVQEQAYGFSLSHPDLNGSGQKFAHCGMDNDFSVSISFRIEEDPPAQWFFRFDLHEMADFIIEGYQNCGSNPSRKEIISHLRKLDERYDHDDLDDRLSRLHSE